MLIIVLLRILLARIRIAILAQVRAGVVFADVLAYHAAAKLPLAFVAVVFRLDGVLAGVQRNGVGGYGICAEQRAFHGLYLHAEEVHQGLVVVGKAYHQVVVNAAVVTDAVLADVDFLAASGKVVALFPVEF